MKIKTHFFVGTALSCYLTYFLLQSEFDTTAIQKIVWLALSPLFGFIAILPDILDKYPCQLQGQVNCTHHCRHPLTHAPWTLLYFIAIAILLPADEEISFILLQITASWFSHLLLDTLNPTGIPLFLKPALENADAKHYSLKRINLKTKRLVFGNINYNNFRWNNTLSLISILSILLFSTVSVLDIIMTEFS